MEVVNRWNGRKYIVIDMTDADVTLRRGDGSEFTIRRSEFEATYRKTEGRS